MRDRLEVKFERSSKLSMKNKEIISEINVEIMKNDNATKMVESKKR